MADKTDWWSTCFHVCVYHGAPGVVLGDLKVGSMMYLPDFTEVVYSRKQVMLRPGMMAPGYIAPGSMYAPQSMSIGSFMTGNARERNHAVIEKVSIIDKTMLGLGYWGFVVLRAPLSIPPLAARTTSCQIR